MKKEVLKVSVKRLTKKKKKKSFIGDLRNFFFLSFLSYSVGGIL